jgi:hypothetical protein
MLLFIVIALSILWISSCVLGLALGAMLARAEGRGSGTTRTRPARARQRAVRAADQMLPTV